MAIKKFNPQDLRDSIDLADKDYTDFHSKNTIAFGSLIESGFDWGREAWGAHNISPAAMDIIRPRINQKIEDRYFIRDVGILPPAIFRKNLVSRLSAAASQMGLLYQSIFDGIDTATTETEALKKRQINSEYPQAMLMTEQQDYASDAAEEAYERTKTEDKLANLLALLEAWTEPDEILVTSVDRCFSQFLSPAF